MANLPRLGLVTAARLLAALDDPTRSRWAIQHLPFSTARFIRGEMAAGPPGASRASLVEWESRVWAMAREQLATKNEPGDQG